jgi:hypothetical protein
MNGVKIFALAAILAGALGLVYGSFTYTKKIHEGSVGPVDLSIKEKETVNVPVWAGVVAIVIGGGLLFYTARKS